MATTVSAVVRRGSSILLVRHATGEGEPDAWFLPGGVVEVGEHLHDATRRELLEEAGVAGSAVSGLGYVSHVVVQLGPDEVTSGQSFVFEVEDPGGEPSPNDPDDDIVDGAFHDLD